MRISHDSAGGPCVAEYSRVTGNLFVPRERVFLARGNDREDQPVARTSARKAIDSAEQINFQRRSKFRDIIKSY